MQRSLCRRVALDRETGDYDTFRRWKVFADDSKELEFTERELRLDDAKDIDADVEPGGGVSAAKTCRLSPVKPL